MYMRATAHTHTDRMLGYLKNVGTEMENNFTMFICEKKHMRHAPFFYQDKLKES